jgi:hypothetical protein
MEWTDVLAIIAFIILLAASIYMLVSFYVCDNQTCKAFKQAENIAPRDTKEYVLSLLNELYNDGIWPFPYIGAAILTPLSLWFIGVPITVKTFAIVFLVSFIVIYFLFSFFGHHYIKFVSSYVSNYIDNNCPTTLINNRKGPIYNDVEGETVEVICKQKQETEGSQEFVNDKEIKINKQGFRSFIEGLDVTFAPPVNNF